MCLAKYSTKKLHRVQQTHIHNNTQHQKVVLWLDKNEMFTLNEWVFSEKGLFCQKKSTWGNWWLTITENRKRMLPCTWGHLGHLEAVEMENWTEK